MKFKNALCLALCLTLFTEFNSIVFAETINTNYQKNLVTKEVQAISNDLESNMSNDQGYWEKDVSGIINIGWLFDSGKWYYFNEKGEMITEWLFDSGKWYYFNEKGEMVTEWLFDSGKWYYFNEKGEMITEWLFDSGKWYYFNEKGEMVTEWLFDSGKWYYFNEKGEMITEWLFDSGKWYYFNEKGEMITEWLFDSGKWYYFNEKGEMVTEWLFDSGKWYYFNEKGEMITGWLFDSGKWYYFNEKGEMVTEWLFDSGKWYYFNEKGEMITGWLNDSGKWYYLQSNGVMAKGWIELSGKWYYMKENGEMAIGWTRVSNKWYYLQANGEMAIGWIKLGDNWYYLNENGSMASNTSVDGYILNSTGEWSKKTVRFVEAEKAAKAYVGSSNVGVFCMDLISGESFGINADKIYPAASTAKLSAIAYAQKRLNEGSLTLNTKYRYYDSVNNMKGAYQRGGSGVLQGQLKEGDYVTVERLIKTTCSYSDNLGANLLAYHVSNQSDATFRSYIKGVLGREIINFTHNLSPKDIALLMQEVYIQGGLALESLKNTSWDNVKIPKYLPVTVAHKIGAHSSANNDVAIVYTNRPYVLAIMTPNYSDNYISNLSKKIYDKLK